MCRLFFFLYSIRGDVMNFVINCDVCQKQGELSLKTKTELQNVPIETAVMKQDGNDVCNLPKVDGFCSLVVCIDYFSKWSEAKPIQDKTAPTIAKFIYELICRHGCFSIQINDQGRGFVNSVSDELHRLTDKCVVPSAGERISGKIK